MLLANYVQPLSPDAQASGWFHQAR